MRREEIRVETDEAAAKEAQVGAGIEEAEKNQEIINLQPQMRREEIRVDLRTGGEMETKTWTGEAAVKREDQDKDQKLPRKEAAVGPTNMQGTLTEGATVGRHQEPQRRAGAGLGTCPGMRKTMEDMRQ